MSPKVPSSNSLNALLDRLLIRGNLLWVNVKDIHLPKDVRDEIEKTPYQGNLVFAVQINPRLDSGVRVYRGNARIVLPALAMKGFRTYLMMLESLAAHVQKIVRERDTLRFKKSEPGVAFKHGRAAVLANGKPAYRGMPPLLTWMRRVRKFVATKNSQIEPKIDSMVAKTSVQAGPKLSTFVLSDSIKYLKKFSFPSSIHVALTNNCNLKCVMCPYHGEKQRKQHNNNYFLDGKHMPGELLKKLIEEAGCHRSHLVFGQYDEPFIYRGFMDYVDMAKKMGCQVSITTNGTLLTEEHARKLILAGVDHISFSLDAATEETYHKIRRYDFNVTLENLKMLVRVRNELQGRTCLRACLVIQDGNRHEQELFRNRMEEIGLDMVSFYVLSQYENGTWVNERLNLDIEAPGLGGNRYACSQLWSQVAVYPDGNVALCCATTLYVGYCDDIPYVGNLQNSSLEEIWLSARYRQIRAEALAGIFNNRVCHDCQIWHNFLHQESYDDHGHLVHQNPYETFVYFKSPSSP